MLKHTEQSDSNKDKWKTELKNVMMKLKLTKTIDSKETTNQTLSANLFL
jgi:hypothetical protein